MKLACVVHRFGADIAGGSEAHCRAVAWRLAAHHDVTIVTTTAKDHVTWKNHYPAGESADGPLRVLRFPVVRPRDQHRFTDISDIVFAGRATIDEQEEWFKENGPDAPELLEFLSRQGREYDRVIFWAFRYADAYFGVPRVADRAILVPTAEADPLIFSSVLHRFFARPSGCLFLTPEEEELVAAQTDRLPPSAVVGCGLDPAPPAVDRSPIAALGIDGPYLLYLGRIDPNKGCEALLRHFLAYADSGRAPIPLVMAGPANMPIPAHPSIRALGFVDHHVREALLAHATALVVPSPYESLSMVLLEAWNHGVPALVNARCRVLKGQVLRADGGLYYLHGAEFAAALEHLLLHPETARRLGAQGLAYIEREYRWPTVMAKIEAFLATLAARGASLDSGMAGTENARSRSRFSVTSEGS